MQKMKKQFQRPSRRLSRKAWIIIGIIVALLLAGGVTAYSVWQSQQATQSNTSDDGIEERPVEENTELTPEQEKARKQAGDTLDPTVTADAATAQANGNTEEAVAIYDKAIEQNTDEDEKVALYIRKAELLVSEGDVQGAIDAAKAAEAIAGPVVPVASMLAALYEVQGELVEAARYYRLAAEAMGEEDELGTRQYYIDSADRLEEQL
ncbi:hypothetical protein CL689_05445 [Candidatus Saccharibacteria bacterium]|nr:hypothetical protein [Candidatus Saccharibacteria bacterium]MBJ58345.1 hypothetical protein [Candidatus Saccharibacteria bacterium]MBQ69487.1 hypothetical protein [Candidatus Saccharibacteria bacterium]|tara:strand:- start:20 stop:643 length:624 start_codon:yes stop_codon:yes gene_type:complete